VHRPHRRTAGLVTLALLGLAPPVAGQEPSVHDSVTLVPGPQFELHGVMRRPSLLLFGSNNRKLWVLPLTLPVADPATEGGGLVPTGAAVTGPDSGVLRFRDGTGGEWQFRPLVRSEPRDLPPLVPSRANRDVLLDMVSGKNPAGALVATPLAGAAGVPVIAGRLISLDDSPQLGAFRPSYGGQAGYLLGPLTQPDSASPDQVAPGTVIDTRELIARLVRSTPDRIDGSSVLRQRLFSIFVGDLNPRWPLWRWEAVRDSAGVVWRPLGRFPEMALADWNGAGPRALRPNLPDLANFGPRYPSQLTGMPAQLTVSRWLIGDLPWPTWDSAAHELQAALTDSVIALAVSRLPPSYSPEFARQLESALRARRDHLPEAARKFHGQLLAHAEVLGPTAGGVIGIDRTGRDTVAITFGSAGPRLYARKVTQDVRLFLQVGSDTVRVTGIQGKHPSLRIIASGAGGDDLIEVAPGAGGGLHLSDPERTFKVEPPGAAQRDRGSYPDPMGTDIWTNRLPRESGVSYRAVPWFEGSSGIGVVLGGGIVRTDWNGSARPYRSRMRLRAGYGTEADKGAVEFTSIFYFASTPLSTSLDLTATGLALVRFYGYGNETAAPGSTSYYRSIQNQYIAATGAALPFGEHAVGSAGLAFKQVETPFQPGHYISVAQPYGTPLFQQAGLTGGFSWDSRDVKGAPHRGVYFTLDAAWYPIVPDGTGPFGSIGGAISTYWTPTRGSRLTLAMRAAGKVTLGPYPVHEAAFVGGGTSVRGLPDSRYAGDASAYGNLDLRIRLARAVAVTTWDFGILGLADAGRVFLAGQTSKVWHPSFGGGLWLALLDRSLVANINVASGAGQGTFVRFGGGFIF